MQRSSTVTFTPTEYIKRVESDENDLNSSKDDGIHNTKNQEAARAVHKIAQTYIRVDLLLVNYHYHVLKFQLSIELHSSFAMFN